jgi:large subunit ribosomal protein L10
MIKEKEIKERQIKDLENTFREVRDLVLLTTSGLDAISENKVRLDLRKKNIRLKLVKNSFMRRVCSNLGMNVGDGFWTGPTTVAWGSASLADLSKELEKTFKGNKFVQFKGAVADGQPVTFEQATKMPTRVEAIGRVVNLILSAGGRLVSQFKGPGGAVASQIKSIGEGKGKEGEQEAAAAPSA